jgi:hypothetical protein
MKTKMLQVLALVLVLVLLPSCAKNATGWRYVYRTDLAGQGKITLVNRAVLQLVISGDHVVYLNLEDQFVYSVPVTGGKTVQLTRYKADPFNTLTVKEGWAYILGGKNLYRIQLDGTGQQNLATDCSQLFRFSEGWIYYVDSTLSQINRIKLDGTGKEKIADKATSSLWGGINSLLVTDGWIYFTYSGSTAEDEKVCRIRHGDQAPEILMTRTSLVLIAAMGDWIYYFNYGDADMSGICRMKKDGTEAARVAAGMGKYSADTDVSMQFYFREDMICYPGMDGNYYQMNPDGTGQRVMADAPMSALTVTNDWIFYASDSDLKKMKPDGSEITTIGTLASYFQDGKIVHQLSYPYQVVGDFVYYIGD